MLTRRQVTKLFAALGVAPVSLPSRAGATTIPWHNWSGYLSSQPTHRHSITSETQLAELMVTTTSNIRPVGAGHSFSPLVPTDGHLVVLDDLQGLIGFDEQNHTAILRAGTRLSEAGAMLHEVGQGMFNLPDIDRQTLAGAIATSTHGTGYDLKSMSGYVNYVRLVTPKGDILDIDPARNSELFQAARVNLGALGIVTAIGFQNRPAFNLRSRTWVEKTSDVIASFPERVKTYEHYEFLPFVHCDYSLVIAHEEVDEPAGEILPEEDGGPIFDFLEKVPIIMRNVVFNSMVQDLPATDKIEPSHLALTNLRHDRFNEMEYSVPAEVGLTCLQEVLATIEAEAIDVVFPLEYREIAPDDTWLSMFSNSRRASISIHRKADEDYKPYFDRIEPIFWKYEGRPHWGKVHSLDYNELSNLYPHLDDFVKIQTELDPTGKMLNPHLKKVLGRA